MPLWRRCQALSAHRVVVAICQSGSHWLPDNTLVTTRAACLDSENGEWPGQPRPGGLVCWCGLLELLRWRGGDSDHSESGSDEESEPDEEP
jgi:hypothetical protein